jgi:hypothetical protein
MEGTVKHIMASLLLVTQTIACESERPKDPPPGLPLAAIPGHEGLQDNSIKEGPRMVPAEAYLRTYLKLFGGLAPIAAQEKLLGVGASKADLFDSWNVYVNALGLPNYVADSSRAPQTNPLMVATYERMGNALCERAMENDWRTNTPLTRRLIFAFNRPAGGVTTLATFETGLDVLHRTFLGYPVNLAPANRVSDMWGVFQSAKRAQAPADAGPLSVRFTAEEAAWTAMCYVLIRHPEFQFY